MNVELPDKLDNKLESVVEDGYYSSKAEVIRTALRQFFQDGDWE